MRRVLLLALLLLCAGPAHAVETVKSPSISKGEFGFEHKGKYEHDSDPALDGRKELEVEISYGVTDFWKTEMGAAFDQQPGSSMVYDGFEWENVVRLSRQEENGFVDFALHQGIEITDDPTSPNELMFGVIARRKDGAFINTANLRYARDFGENAANGFNFVYRWQTRYEINELFQPGIEVFGDTNKSDALKGQELKVGPVLLGGFEIGEGQAVEYLLGYTFGATPATPEGTFRWGVEYVIQLN